MKILIFTIFTLFLSIANPPPMQSTNYGVFSITNESVANSPKIISLLSTISQLIGTPYKYGSTDFRKGLDCSAFTSLVFSKALDIKLPRTSYSQYKFGVAVKKDSVNVGDLVFFKSAKKKRISHVGIYVGNEKFAHASSKYGVIISDLAKGHYNHVYAGSRRIFNISKI